MMMMMMMMMMMLHPHVWYRLAWGMAWVARLAALTVGLSRSDHRLAHMGP